jgi:hypothetical protein
MGAVGRKEGATKINVSRFRHRLKANKSCDEGKEVIIAF